MPLVSLCVHRDAPATMFPTGISMPSQGCTLRQTPNQDAPRNLPPPFRVLYFYTIYLTRDSTAQRVCSSSRVLFFYTTYLTGDSTAQRVCPPGAGFNPPEFLSPCVLPVSCCLAVSVVRSRPDSAGPARSSLAQDLYGSGRHENGIRTAPLPVTLACAASR